MPDKWNDSELDDLLADYNIVKAKKAQNRSTSVQDAPAKTAPAVQAEADVPRRPDGTPYSIGELRQIQASRQAMRSRQNARQSTDQTQPAAYRNAQTGTDGSRQPSQRQGERARQSAAYEAAYRQQNQGPKKPVYKHRKIGRPNGAVLLFVLLVLAVGGVSIGQIVKNHAAAAETDNPTIQTPAGTETEEGAGDTAETEEADADALMLWNTTEISNDRIHEGDLILVNYQYPYPNADTIDVLDVYGNKNGYYQVSSTNITLTRTALDAMNDMTTAFYDETGSNDMIIVSGYRNVQSQRDIYNDRVATQGEEMAALYVATPGYSEHHTGLSMDLSFYTDEGTSVSIENYEHGPWINENCADYGFVLRYPADKVDITKIGYEFWHYRYVGFPHAQIMTEKNLCLEEYIDYIREYTTETKLLWIQPGGIKADVSAAALPKEGCLVYYVPASEGDTTEIRVPRGNIFGEPQISGNNVDGFIVTVEIGTEK